MLSVKPDRSLDETGGDAAIFNEAPGELPVPAFGYHLCQGRRPENEDRVSVNPRLNGSSQMSFFGVYDGHSGQKCAEHIKRAIPLHLSSQIGRTPPPNISQVEVMLTSAYKTADKEFCSSATANKWEDGSTACTVFISGLDLVCANAGDSKAVLSRMGKPVVLSKEHKPHQPAESARIKAAGGKVVIMDGVSRINGNIATSRSLGDAALKNFVIPDPEFVTRKLSKGDDWVIIASDGLWDYVDNATACSLCMSAGSATKAADVLVNSALQNDSYDNISVVVIDLRSFWNLQVDTKSVEIPFNLQQRVKKMGDDVVARTDFTMMEPDACGWLQKESSGGIMGKRWQRRWFLLHAISAQADFDSSMHNSAGNKQFSLTHFVLHYHDSEEKAKGSNPRKPLYVDPQVGARRESEHDKPGIFTLSLFDIATGEPILLAADSAREAEQFVVKFNNVFQGKGFKPGGVPGKDINQRRTLSMMEATNPNMVRTQTGSMVPMPNGVLRHGQDGSATATGPLQLIRTTTGGLMAVGGGWSCSAAELAQKELALSLARPGFVLSLHQTEMLGVPPGSVIVQ